MKQTNIIPKYVDYIPEKLDKGVLYICNKYQIASHLCCCGCGKEVITPLSPADWSIRRVGKTISMHPSIGNWSFPCQSHYIIQNNAVIWAGALSSAQIAHVREQDQTDKLKYIAILNKQKEPEKFSIFKYLANFISHIFAK